MWSPSLGWCNVWCFFRLRHFRFAFERRKAPPPRDGTKRAAATKDRRTAAPHQPTLPPPSSTATDFLLSFDCFRCVCSLRVRRPSSRRANGVNAFKICRTLQNLLSNNSFKTSFVFLLFLFFLCGFMSLWNKEKAKLTRQVG